MMAEIYPPIETLLPHAPPMVLLDCILQSNSSRTVCAVKIQEESPFLTAKGVSNVISLEYMAQCIAARAGLKALERGEKPKSGFIIGCRQMEFHVAAFQLHSDLVVVAEESMSASGFSHFQCEIRDQDRLLVVGVLSVASFTSNNTDSNDN